MILIKKILFLSALTLLFSCANYENKKRDSIKERKYYTSHGFALIYENSLYEEKIINKKLINDDFFVIHDFLKINTPVKIINPDNSKFVEAKVYKKANYPKIFNVVINNKIASFLELDVDNPYVEVNEVKKNKTFIAKESNTFEEEKKVAEKAPVEVIKMDDLSQEKEIIKKKITQVYNYILIISDFYYVDSANNLKKELIDKTKMKNIYVKKIKDNKYRLFMGPFKSFNALKKPYISLNNLGFEGLNIYRE